MFTLLKSVNLCKPNLPTLKSRNMALFYVNHLFYVFQA